MRSHCDRELEPGPIRTAQHESIGHRARVSPVSGLLGILLLAAAVWYARHVLRSTFSNWDDEGYFLLTLRTYLAGLKPYTETFTQYGPFYFAIQEFWFGLLRIPATHDGGRAVTMVYWLVSAGLGAGTIYTVSRSFVFSCFAFAACVAQGYVLANEPNHPQGIILVLLALAMFVSIRFCRTRPELSLFVLGAAGSAVALTKINVGAFYLFALLHAAICVLAPFGTNRIASRAIVCLAGILPAVLANRHFPAALNFVVLASVCSVPVFAWGANVVPRSRPERSLALWPLAGMVAGTLAIVAWAVSQGIAIPVLIRGVITDPMRHPGLLYTALPVRPWQLVWAFTIVIAGFLLLKLPNLRQNLASYRRQILAARALIGLLAIPLLLTGRIGWFLPLIALVLLSEREEQDWFDLFPRVFLACLAVMQFLQIYPVAGSQIGIASFPSMVCALIFVAEGAEPLWRTVPLLQRFQRETVFVCLALAGCVLVAGKTWPKDVRPLGFDRVPSELPGSSSLLLDPARKEAFTFLADQLRANCDVVLSLPGMRSFNAWSGLPTLDGWNDADWVMSMPPGRQQKLLTAFRAHAQGCAILNVPMLQVWHTSETVLANAPLAQHMLRNMKPVARRGNYEIRVQPDRPAPAAQ